MNDSLVIYRAAAIRDAAGLAARPGAIAVRGGRIVAVGEPDAVVRLHGRDARATVELPDSLILPAMVNAHAHLDLTGIGPRPYGGAFVPWIEDVMRLRPRDDADITAAVREGLRLSRAAGVGWIGDIAGSDQAARARMSATADEWIDGVSYLECLGTGEHVAAAAKEAIERWGRLSTEARTSAGALRHLDIQLQPHALYSTGFEVFEAASNLFSGGLPSTHLAETLEEDQFVRSASGPIAELLKRLGKHRALKTVGQSPIAYFETLLNGGFWLLTHCNYVDDADLMILAQNCDISVAYCPVASAYFGHRNHRYRDMLAAGINVCLGTDSILCQPPGEKQPLGILPAMRLLHRRDGTGPAMLLAMATRNGLRALGLDPGLASFAPGAPAKLIAARIDPADSADPLTQALRNDYPVVALEHG